MQSGPPETIWRVYRLGSPRSPEIKCPCIVSRAVWNESSWEYAHSQLHGTAISGHKAVGRRVSVHVCWGRGYRVLDLCARWRSLVFESVLSGGCSVRMTYRGSAWKRSDRSSRKRPKKGGPVGPTSHTYDRGSSFGTFGVSGMRIVVALEIAYGEPRPSLHGGATEEKVRTPRRTGSTGNIREDPRKSPRVPEGVDPGPGPLGDSTLSEPPIGSSTDTYRSARRARLLAIWSQDVLFHTAREGTTF